MITKRTVIFGRLLILLTFVIGSSMNGWGQLKHGLHVQAGMAKLQSNSMPVFAEPTEIEVLDNFDLSWTIGYSISKNFDNGLAVQFGADVLLLSAKRLETYIRNDENFTNIDSEIKATYLGFPFLAGIKVQNISILTGLRASIFLSSQLESSSYGETDGIEFSENGSFKPDLDTVDLGHHTALKYGLGDKLEIVLSYYYGFSALSNKVSDEYYYQQLSIGVGYIIN